LKRRPGKPAPDDRAVRTPRRRSAAAACVLLGAVLAGCAASPRPALERSAASLPASVELEQVPFYPQSDQQCGPAAVATLLGAAGRDATPEGLAGELFLPGRQGSLQPEMVAALRTRGLVPYPLDGSMTELLREVAAGRAVLVLQKQGLGPWPAWHYAVVVGYDTARDRLLLRSGTDARLELRAAVFEASWERGGRWAIVALDPGEMPARPDLQRYMAAAASLEATGHSEPARRAYEAAAREWPDSALPQLGLANVAATQGDWMAAERGYAAVLRLQPGNAAAINNRAEVLARLGCPQAAHGWLARAGQRVATEDPLRPALARTLAALEVHAAGAPEPATHCVKFDADP
jgi:hypothetical protein